MARKARVVVPGLPHHITQRGNNRQEIFLKDEDMSTYMSLLAHYSALHKLDIWAYCLMPNHIHLIAVPPALESMADVIKCVHMRYTQYFNEKYDCVGHLWQSRYYSAPMSEAHTRTAVWYVETNPVRAEIVEKAEEYKWSSAQSRFEGYSDTIISNKSPLLNEIKDWNKFLKGEVDNQILDEVLRNTISNLPSGDTEFVANIEQKAGRMLKRSQAGRPSRT